MLRDIDSRTEEFNRIYHCGQTPLENKGILVLGSSFFFFLIAQQVLWCLPVHSNFISFFLWSTQSGFHEASWCMDRFFYFPLHFSDLFDFVRVFSPNILSMIRIMS